MEVAHTSQAHNSSTVSLDAHGHPWVNGDCITCYPEGVCCIEHYKDVRANTIVVEGTETSTKVLPPQTLIFRATVTATSWSTSVISVAASVR